MRYWRLMGQYDSETTAYTPCAGANATSPFTPPESARLKAVRVVIGRNAATSLIDHIQFKLTSTSFIPNAIEVGGQGTGLQTAPALQGGAASALDWECDQPVTGNQPITIEGRNVTADTPVTVNALVYGLFDNGRT